MKTLTLDFVPRFRLVSLLGNIECGGLAIAEMETLQQLWAKLAFTEEEEKGIEKIDLGNGQTTFKAPSLEFGRISIELENTPSSILTKKLETGLRGSTIHDVLWIKDVRRQLTQD